MRRLCLMVSSALYLFASSSLYSLLLLLTTTDAIKFKISIPRLSKRCYYQDVLKNTLVVVSAAASAGRTASLEILDDGLEVQKEEAKGYVKTAFTAPRNANYEICFENQEPTKEAFAVSIEQGPEVKDYTNIAKKEHMEPLVILLRHAEDRLIEYHRNIIHIQSSQGSMRQLMDSTASKVVLFCILTVSVLLLATLVQFLYLRRFLRSKKII